MYAFCTDLPGLTAAEIAKVDAELGPELPEGLIGHVSGPSSTGWRIIDIWASEEHSIRFNSERLGPAMGRAFGPNPGGMPPEVRAVTGDPELSKLP
jgi:hypothetical protein